MSQYPNTVHIVQRMATGGIETFVLDLVNQPSQRDFAVSLEGTREALIEDWPALASVSDRLAGLGAHSGIRPGIVLKLVKVLRDLRPASVMLHHIGPLLYGGIAARLAGVPNIIHVEHDTWHYTAQPRHRLIARGVERLVRPRHICQSKATARQLAAILPGADISTIPAGIDLARFCPRDKAAARQRLGLPEHGAIVGTVGRLVPVKGHRYLIAAFRYLPRPARLVIAGEGPERAALETQAEAEGIRDSVTFLGHRDDVAGILPAFDIFCLPSLSEGVPRSLLEAQACDIPVVATNVGAVREAVCAETGILVVPANPILLADALNRALAGGSATPPRRFVEEHYSWQKTLNSYRQLAEA